MEKYKMEFISLKNVSFESKISLLKELGRIRKTTIDYGDEKVDKLTIFTK